MVKSAGPVEKSRQQKEVLQGSYGHQDPKKVEGNLHLLGKNTNLFFFDCKTKKIRIYL